MGADGAPNAAGSMRGDVRQLGATRGKVKLGARHVFDGVRKRGPCRVKRYGEASFPSSLVLLGRDDYEGRELRKVGGGLLF